MISGTLPRGPGTRGQTPQDYVIGIVVFIAVLVVVIGFLPTLTEPFQSGVQSDDSAQADRVAQQAVANLSTVKEPNQLNSTKLDRLLELDGQEMQDRFGLPVATQVNLTVVTLNGSDYVENAADEPLTSKNDYFSGNAATTARIVRLSGDGHTCEPACRLVVRVW